MKYLTKNIGYTSNGYGHFKVTDLENKVSVVVESWVIDDCDEEDDESVEKCLERLRTIYKREDLPRYNIVVNLGSKGERYMIGENGEWDCNPLCYKDAFEPNEVSKLLKIAKDMYLGAWTEEVEPFSW